MKKKFKTILICIIVLLFVSVCLPFLKGVYYYFYNSGEKDYYGENYNEILHIASLNDRYMSSKVLKQIDDAFSFIGTKDEADEKFGVLGRYTVDSSRAVSEEHDLKFITANLYDESGYIWVSYSQEIFDDNGNSVGGSWNVLSRMYLSRRGKDIWAVVNIWEHP